jgi:SAM-dependent methyltransferase
VSAYRHDLAWIHHAGFSEFARSAAPGVLALLPPNTRVIVEAGCGSGVLARILTDKGFDVIGFDASSAMIELARVHAPDARFEVARFADAMLPPCDAILAMGEVLNYGTLDEVKRFVAKASQALTAGGVLLFDVAERGSYPPHDERRVGGDDWSVIAIKDSDGTRLTRRVLTFREIDGVVRRDEEVHELELYAREELTAILREHGFRILTRRSYGSRRLPPGHILYIAERRDLATMTSRRRSV